MPTYSLPDAGPASSLRPEDDAERCTTFSCRRTISHIARRASLLALADVSGTVILVQSKDAASLAKGPLSVSRLKTEGKQVLALEICMAGEQTWVAVAFARGETGEIKVFDDSSHLHATLPPLHRTPPTSLSASASSSGSQLLASLSPSELLLFDTTSWTCTWALKGPSPTSSLVSPLLSAGLWIPQSSPSADEGAHFDALSIWDSEEMCLWSTPPANDVPEAEMKLQWRASPRLKPARSVHSSPVAAVSANGILFTTSHSTTLGKTDLLIWDVEERALLQRLSFDLGAISSLRVLECSPQLSVLLLLAENDLYHLELPSSVLPPSLVRVLSDVDQFVVGPSSVVTVVENNRVRMYELGALIHESPSDNPLRPTSVAADSPVQPNITQNSRSSMTSHEATGGLLAFDENWLRPTGNKLLQRQSIIRYLNAAGSFPPQHRTAAYSLLLSCPSSSKFFTLLSTPEDIAMMDAFRAEWELADWDAQSRMESMIHLLRSHCLDSISLIDRVPPILYGLVVAFPSSLATDQELFEISLTVLMRWGRIIWLEEEETRKGRMVLWKLIERALERKRVLGELREKGVEVVNIISSVVHGLLNGILTPMDWIIVLDHIISRPPLFFIALIASAITYHTDEISSLPSKDVLAFFRQPHPVSPPRLIQEATRILEELRGTSIAQRLEGVPGFEGDMRLDATYQLVPA